MSLAAALLALSVLSPLQMMRANLSSPPSDFTNVRRSFSNALVSCHHLSPVCGPVAKVPCTMMIVDIAHQTLCRRKEITGLFCVLVLP